MRVVGDHNLHKGRGIKKKNYNFHFLHSFWDIAAGVVQSLLLTGMALTFVFIGAVHILRFVMPLYSRWLSLQSKEMTLLGSVLLLFLCNRFEF